MVAGDPNESGRHDENLGIGPFFGRLRRVWQGRSINVVGVVAQSYVNFQIHNPNLHHLRIKQGFPMPVGRPRKIPARIFYATSGPADLIAAHHHWKKGEPHPNVVSVTFSSQIQDACRKLGAQAYLVSSNARNAVEHDPPFTLEHRPNSGTGAAGLKYHVSMVRRGLDLLRTARRFNADLAILDSGCTHYFMFSLFWLFRIRVVTVLHNALWPKGHPPTRPIPRLVMTLNSVLFWRRLPEGAICMSPECERQILSQFRKPPARRMTFVALAQFYRDRYENIPPPPAHSEIPFQIMFVGRVVIEKGVFDILEMARRIQDRMPGRVRWVLCGDGADLGRLRSAQREMGLESIVEIRGWTLPAAQAEIYARSHAAIVPSRSDCGEAMAMTAIEAVLAGRPVITNDVVPALELLKPACAEARTDDVESYVEQIIRLVTDESEYRKLCLACAELGEQFYNRENGLAAVLERVVTRSA